MPCRPEVLVVSMFVGPLFTRQWRTAPRSPRHFISRSVYVAALLGLTFSAWIVVTGTQDVRNLGDLAHFGAVLFQILAPLQLALVMFIAALTTASSIAQEKDRRTLELLLLTRLNNSELVCGKLLANLLNVAVLLLASLPLFMLLTLLGGVSFGQVGSAFGVTLMSCLAAGSLGSTIALWREKTFQILAMTAVVIVLWLGVWGLADFGAFGAQWHGVSTHVWAASFSPLPAITAATRPIAPAGRGLFGLANPVSAFFVTAAVETVLLNLLAVWRVRAWNPSQEIQVRPDDQAAGDATRVDGNATTPAASRAVWDNPILWREVRTWAYGRRVLLVKFAYVVLFLLAAAAIRGLVLRGGNHSADETVVALIPLFILSLILVNALGVTSITTERDGRALDLLLVTDLTPKEFIFGKLLGVFYNGKEMILLPMLLCGYLWWTNLLTGENLCYLIGGLSIMNLFVATLGIHAGMIYDNSRNAVGVSLGTVFFLFVGIATCIRIMVSFSGSYQLQLAPFLAFMIGGACGLFVALGARNPSQAIGWASLALPTFTYVAITSYLQQETLGVFVIVALTYSFTTAAMLVPAIYEFDVATGRTTAEEGM